MIRVVVRVDQPYATKPPLAMGLFVWVELQGHELPNLTVIPRSALRQGNTVWVVDSDERLRYRPVQVARIDGDQVQISSGLQTGDQVVISHLKTVIDGMAVRPIPSKEADPS
jgi:multidrug efflux pump subunit AcrA (membrane-fusion protein)